MKKACGLGECLDWETSNEVSKLRFSVNTRRLQVLQLLGQGGYSNVYQVMDKSSSELYALKIVNLKMTESVGSVVTSTSTSEGVEKSGYLYEVEVLKKFQKFDRVIRLVDHQVKDNNNFRQQNDVIPACIFDQILYN